MANTREMPAMDQHAKLSLAEVLHSCKSYEEALSKVRHINQECREDLPAWTPAVGSVLQQLREMVLYREHLPDCCDMLKFQAIYASSGKVVDPKPLIVSYLQFNSFTKRIVSLKAAVTDMQLFWQYLNWLLKCLLRNSRDALLRHLPEIGLELLCSVLDTSAHIDLRRQRIEELNRLLKVSSQGDLETFKKCALQAEDLCNLLKIAGDYDFQTSIVEAIFFVSTTAERVRCVSQWFPMVDSTVHSLFTRISDFEPDCRRFLNAYNAAYGRYRQVYTFPCISAFVGKLQLTKPKAANYAKFWVDFNTACSSVLLFYQMMDSSPDEPWESLTVAFDDIKTVTLYRAVHSFRLVFVMKHVEDMVTLFSSNLLQKYKDLVSDTITLEFECSEFLQQAAYLLYKQQLNIISQEPENLKYGKKHKKSKVSASLQHKSGVFLSGHSGHSSVKKTSISKQKRFLDTEDTQFTPSEKVSPQKSPKKFKAYVNIMDIDACASPVRNEGITENTKASIAVVPGESDGNVQNQVRKEYIDSPHISGSLDRYLPTQDADLLNRAMDSYENKEKQKKLDSSSESDIEIVPCSLCTQEKWESHRVHVDLKSRKKQCQKINWPQSTGPKSSDHANCPRNDSGKIDAVGKKRGRGRSPLSPRTKQARVVKRNRGRHPLTPKTKEKRLAVRHREVPEQDERTSHTNKNKVKYTKKPTWQKCIEDIEDNADSDINKQKRRHLHTPSSHDEMLQNTPPCPVPRDLFNTAKGSGRVTDDANIKIMYDVLDILWTPMSNASSALNRVVTA